MGSGRLSLRRSGELLGVAVLLAAVCITAIIALIQVATDRAAADRAAAARDQSPAAAQSRTQAPNGATPAPSSSPVARSTPVPAGPVTYVVKRGDNLTVIANWFKLHGYGRLYERNREVIGNDPNLIRPGQQITISPTGVTTPR